VEVIVGVAVVGLLALAGLLAGILRVAVTTRRRAAAALGGQVERRLRRGGAAGRMGVEHGLEALAARLTAPLWLAVIAATVAALLLTALAWDGPSSLGPVALGAVVGLALARMATGRVRRIEAAARRPRRGA
jgi:hypothetical protein